MSLAAAMLASTALASSASGPAICAGCSLDAPPRTEAAPLLVVLRGDASDDLAWRAPALAAGFAVLSLTGWENGDPSWLEEQVFAAARQRSIDLARVYLVGGGEGAAYISRHVPALGETFAAIAITGGGRAPANAACPDQTVPTYFWVDADDAAARAMRGYLERCKQPVTWTVARGPLDKETATTILTWMHHRLRVTTVAM